MTFCNLLQTEFTELQNKRKLARILHNLSFFEITNNICGPYPLLKERNNNNKFLSLGGLQITIRKPEKKQSSKNTAKEANRQKRGKAQK